MKIAFLTPEYPNPKIVGNMGGIGTSILNLSKALTQLGHQVIVFVHTQDEDSYFEQDGIFIYKIKNVKVKGFSRYFTQIKIENLIKKINAKDKIDLIEVPDWGNSFFIVKHCPVVIRLHGSDTYFCHLDHRPVKWINYFHEKKILKNADAFISVSDFTAKLTNELFKLKINFTVIPNGIDIDNFQSNSDLINSDTILYFGTLIRKKGLLELPLIFNEVVKINKNAKLVLVGKDSADILSGNSSTWAMMLALFSEEAIQKVTYLGAVPYLEIKKYIQNATVCVFPTFAEALPVSWLEAMAMNKPVVASNIGWASEIIEDNIDGFLVHPQNHFEYALKISTLLNDKELQVKIGNSARKKIEKKFTNNIVAAQSVAFYQDILCIKNENY